MPPSASLLSVAPASQASAGHILIVDDHELVRLGLSTLIAAHAAGAHGAEVLQASTLAQALDLYSRHGEAIALVLLDLHLPDTHGLSGLRSFLARFPRAPIAVLSGSGDPTLMREAAAVGASKFFNKSGQLSDVIDYIRQQGLLGAAPAPAATAPASAAPSTDARASERWVQTLDGERVRLTPRQAELLDCVLSGQSNREITERVHLSEGTVKNHVSALLLMFGVRSRAQLISRLR